MEKIEKTDAEWRAELPDMVYRVTRQHGTERAGSHEGFPDAPGQFRCACCGLPVFDSAHKFDSGTGWPSFYKPADDQNVETSEDRKLFMTRTEVHCARCEAHLGHVFPDGPEPTGLRYCINGVALDYEAKDGAGNKASSDAEA